MSSSEEQFQELIAHSVARSNRMLAQSNIMLPYGLMLKPGGNVDIALSINDDSITLNEQLNLIQGKLTESVEQLTLVATAIVYPDYEEGAVVILLENSENYCNKALIPVNTDSTPVLDVSGIEFQDGSIYIFPAHA